MFIPPSLTPHSHPLPPRKIGRVCLTPLPCTLIDSPLPIPTHKSIVFSVNFLGAPYNILRVREAQIGNRQQSFNPDFGMGIVKLICIIFEPHSWSQMLVKQRNRKLGEVINVYSTWSSSFPDRGRGLKPPRILSLVSSPDKI